jgi:hypothetical protein
MIATRGLATRCGWTSLVCRFLDAGNNEGLGTLR